MGDEIKVEYTVDDPKAFGHMWVVGVAYGAEAERKAKAFLLRKYPGAKGITVTATERKQRV